MTSPRFTRRLAPFLLAAAAVFALDAGCSRLLPVRHGAASSSELVIDTRQDPTAALSGRIIPGVFPAVTRWPVLFVEKIPFGAVMTEATFETVSQTGEAPAVLQAAVEDNQVFLKCAMARATSAAEVHLRVHAKYEYRW
jgi:hypothetical protein